MKNIVQWILGGLLLVVIALQIIVIRKMPAEVNVPSLGEIDQRIRHWTMHHGATFSSQGRLSSLESRMNERFDRMENKLKVLEKSYK